MFYVSYDPASFQILRSGTAPDADALALQAADGEVLLETDSFCTARGFWVPDGVLTPREVMPVTSMGTVNTITIGGIAHGALVQIDGPIGADAISDDPSQTVAFVVPFTGLYYIKVSLFPFADFTAQVTL